jgi:nicotinamide phosphoribosyltransferase
MIMQGYVDQTCDDTSITKYLISDFSLRGLTEIESAAFASSGGHLLSFAKSATVGVVDFLETYYDADLEKDLPKTATPSLEHSVVCQGITKFVEMLEGGGEYKGIRWDDFKNDLTEYGEPVDIKLVAEMCFLKYLIIELQPEGALSYVSDTYSYWDVLTWILPKLKDDILNRKGVLIIRPDSGDPTRIVCGYSRAVTWFEQMGSIKVLDKIFGATKNKKGYLVLPPQIRLIYADAITRERNVDIPKYIIADGYSVENLYFGIGSVSYQFVTRDSRGYAIKATSVTLNDGRELPLQKKPKTDGEKTSQKGCFAAHYDENGKITYTDELTYDEAVDFEGNLYVLKFKDGKQYNLEDFATIRNRLWGGKF